MFRISTLFRRAAALAAASLLAAGVHAQTSAAGTNPTSVKVMLYKTEIYNGSAWVTVFNNSAGAMVDLVTGTGSVLGSTPLPNGIYDGLRMTIGSTITFSGTNAGCTGTSTATDMTRAIAATSQTTVAFATAVTGGQIGYYADGSATKPLLMTAPIEVVRGQTTEVNLNFNTAGSLVCDTAGNIEQGPVSINVVSVLKASSYAFTGGDYWVASYAQSAAGLHDLQTGAYLDPTVSDYKALLSDPTAGAAYMAQWRSNSRYEVGWSAKVRFSAPDASGHGTLHLLRMGGTHRHQMDENWCQSMTGGCAAQGLGVTPEATSDMATPMVMGTYALGADNRIYISDGSGHNSVGAFSQDFGVVTAGDLTTTDRATLQIGVRASTTAPTLAASAGVMGNLSYGLDMTRDDVAVAGAAYGVVKWSRLALSAGWSAFDLATNIQEHTDYQSTSRWDNPTLTPPNFVATTGQDNYYRLDSPFTIPTINADGTISAGGNWTAISPGLALMMGVRGTTDLDAAWTTPGVEERHGLGFDITLLQAPVGTHTVSNLAGRYFLSGMWDDTSTSAPLNGSSVAVITLGADGSVKLQGSDRDTYGSISAMSGSGTYTVSARCNGLNQAARDAQARLNAAYTAADAAILADPANRLDPALSQSACRTAGGRSLDTVVVKDGAGKEIAHLMASADGRVLAYHNPSAFSDAKSRSLGTAIRLN